MASQIKAAIRTHNRGLLRSLLDSVQSIPLLLSVPKDASNDTALLFSLCSFACSMKNHYALSLLLARSVADSANFLPDVYCQTAIDRATLIYDKFASYDNLLSHDRSVPSPLVIAAWLGYLPLVKYLLSIGCDLNTCSVDPSEFADQEKTPNGEISPLVIAINESHSKVIDYLFDQPNLKINFLAQKGIGHSKSPVMIAARKNFPHVLSRLLSIKSCSFNVADDQGFSLIHYTAFYGMIPEMEQLLDLGCDVNLPIATIPKLKYHRFHKNQQRMTPIHLSLSSIESLKLLLSRDCDLNVDLPPLAFAIENENLEAVELMLSAGADPDVPYEDYPSLFYYALEKKYTSNNFDFPLSIFLSVGADIHVQSPTCGNLLYLATHYKNEPDAKFFLQSGVDPIGPNEQTSPLLESVYADRKETLLKLFTKHFGYEFENGMNILKYAIVKHRYYAINYILRETGALVSIELVRFAILNNVSTSIMKLLISKCEKTKPDPEDDTLVIASKRYFEVVLRGLFRIGFNPKLLVEGKNVLEHLCERRNRPTVSMFDYFDCLGVPVEIYIPDNEGRTLIHRSAVVKNYKYLSKLMVRLEWDYLSGHNWAKTFDYHLLMELVNDKCPIRIFHQISRRLVRIHHFFVYTKFRDLCLRRNAFQAFYGYPVREFKMSRYLYEVLDWLVMRDVEYCAKLCAGTSFSKTYGMRRAIDAIAKEALHRRVIVRDRVVMVWVVGKWMDGGLGIDIYDYLKTFF